MERIILLLNKIRERPVLYLGKPKVERLKAFIDGYMTYMEEEGTYCVLFDEFQSFVQKRYKIYSSQNWSNIIDFFSSSDQNAFDLFYKLFDEFLEIKQK